MIQHDEPLAPHLQEPTQLGDEISLTGKWVPVKKGGIFRKSAESQEMLKEWEDIHSDAKANSGILSTEINHAVGEDAVLIHHVFKDSDALVDYFSTTATEHIEALRKVAKPETQFIRGVNVPKSVQDALSAKNVPVFFGNFLYGFVKDGYKRPNYENAIMVTAKWACKPSDSSNIDELKYWWQRVATDAYTLEEGMLRFEAYEVPREDALIIHEVFDSSDELKFHLTKGTAAKYKSELDKIAEPESYFFRGPVSWTIRTYSRFMHLPATYSSLGSNFTRPGGSMSDGLL